MLAKRSSPASKTYAVAGKTLAEINKDILKKGPADPNDGKRYAGSCRGTLTLAIGAKDFAFATTPDSSPVEVTATVSGGSLTSTPAINMPKLASEKGLSPDALKEWKRFVGKTQIHEDGHADSFYTLAVAIAQEITATSATGTGKDEKAAQVAAQKALIDQLGKTYGGGVLDGRINDDIKDYDAKTKHGATQGAVLDTSIT